MSKPLEYVGGSLALKSCSQILQTSGNLLKFPVAAGRAARYRNSHVSWFSFAVSSVECFRHLCDVFLCECSRPCCRRRRRRRTGLADKCVRGFVSQFPISTKQPQGYFCHLVARKHKTTQHIFSDGKLEGFWECLQMYGLNGNAVQRYCALLHVIGPSFAHLKSLPQSDVVSPILFSHFSFKSWPSCPLNWSATFCIIDV